MLSSLHCEIEACAVPLPDVYELVVINRSCFRPLSLSFSLTLSPQARALVSYLSTNVPLFRPSVFSGAALRRLVQRCPIYTITAEQVADGHYIFIRGVPATCCCLLLHGRVQVSASVPYNHRVPRAMCHGENRLDSIPLLCRYVWAMRVSSPTSVHGPC